MIMIFEKPSTRTRISFDLAIKQLGGSSIILNPDVIHYGKGDESLKDTARVLSEYADILMIRTSSHKNLEEFTKFSKIPVINGLSDLSHPCQVMSDILTFEEINGNIEGKTISWIGDGNNMAHSWIVAAQVLGFELRLACPDGYLPDEKILSDAVSSGARITQASSAHDAARGAHVVTTDVWASMGQEDETRIRKQAFSDYVVDGSVMAVAQDNAIFLHCLPAHRGEEVTADVIDGPQSKIYDEAENRLHIQKAILDWSLGGCTLSQ